MIPADVVRLRLTRHAIQRFGEYSAVSDGRSEADLLVLASGADEVEPGALRGLVDDGRGPREEEARYYRAGNWILACKDRGAALHVVTVFPGDRVWRFARLKGRGRRGR